MSAHFTGRSVRLAVRVWQVFSLLTMLALAGGAVAAFDEDEQSCIAGGARAMVAATAIGGDVSAGCIAALAAAPAGEPDPLPGDTIERCVERAPAVWRKRTADDARSERLCAKARSDDPPKLDPRLDFGLAPGGADAAARAGSDGLVELVRDVFGPAPEDTVRARGDAPGARTCQRVTWAAVRACAAARQSALIRCLRDGLAERDPLRQVNDVHALRDRCLGTGSSSQPDPHGWIARRCTAAATGLASVLERHCADQDVAALLPGCAAESATGACLERKVACRTCLTVNRALGTTRNCDRFDNGADDGTCGCGDGIATPFEQCDDGNDDEGDGCTTSCTEGPAYCPCYTGADIEAAFPAGFFDAFGKPECVDDPDFGVAVSTGTCLIPSPRSPPFSFPRVGAGILDGICFFNPLPLSSEDGGVCISPSFQLITGSHVLGCRNLLRRSQAWQRECGGG